jgi:5'(3')-deoxyribonucleotidase
MTIKTVILDLDEVLADFVGAACFTHGTSVEKLWDVWEPGEWDMSKPLGISSNEFWREIRLEGSDFWENLSPTPWMEELIHLVDSSFPEWHIVTAPDNTPECHLGKVRWIKEYLGKSFNNFSITPHKHLFAQPGVVIIDDRQSTVEKFISYGGQGILFPAHHNANYQLKSDPMDHIRNQLNQLKGY